MRKGAVESFLLHATGMGLLIAMHIVLARLIGPRDYGIYSYALTITTLLALIVPLGWPTALMRFISQYREDQSWGLLKGAFLRAHQITFGSSCFTATVLFAASYIRAIPSDMTTSLRFASLLLPILSFVGLRRKALQGLQCIKASITFEEILLPVLVIACCLLFGISTAVLYRGFSQFHRPGRQRADPQLGDHDQRRLSVDALPHARPAPAGNRPGHDHVGL